MPPETSYQEKLLWNALEHRIVDFELRFHTQHKIDRYFVDFACLIPDKRVVIEVLGWEHHSEKGQFEKDSKRTRVMFREDWTVISFTNDEIDNDVNECADEIIELFKLDNLRIPAGENSENHARIIHEMYQNGNNLYTGELIRAYTGGPSRTVNVFGKRVGNIRTSGSGTYVDIELADGMVTLVIFYEKMPRCEAVKTSELIWAQGILWRMNRPDKPDETAIKTFEVKDGMKVWKELQANV